MPVFLIALFLLVSSCPNQRSSIELSQALHLAKSQPPLADDLEIESLISGLKANINHLRKNGANMHVSMPIGANDRAGLERQLRYMGRPPLSDERLTMTAQGKISVKLKTPWSDGSVLRNQGSKEWRCSCRNDEGRSLGIGSQMLVPNHCKRLQPKSVVVSVTEKA